MKTANEYYKETFGTKIYRISLNGGMSCPNRDGTLHTRGCIFCSRGGSGDFAADAALSIPEQLAQAKALVASKLPAPVYALNGTIIPTYLAYFQAFTNTYAPIPYLRRIFTEAISDSEVAGLSIATRPDCIDADTIALLSELNAVKPIYIELGLQTIHEESARFIRRGYPLSRYDNAVSALSAAGIPVITHIILGLPYETKEQMLETVRYVCNSHIHGIKLQLLHILKDTDLADFYIEHKDEPNVFACMEQEAYFSVIKDCLPLIPDDMVVYRLTGDGPKRSLLAPLWSADKKRVLNALQQIRKDTKQCNQKC